MAPGELEQLLKHSEGARRLAQGLLGDVHGGDDVAQDALVTALRKAPTGLRNPRAWLYKVTRTQARENARKESRRRRHEGAAARSDVVDRSADVAKRAALQKQLIDAVLRLPEAYRVPVWMRFFDEVPPRKIAAALDLPVETARTRIRRGLERLRVDLDREHGGDDRWRAALLPLLGEMGGAMGAKSFAGSVAVLVLVGALIATAVAWLGSDEGLPGAPDGELLAGKPAKSEVALVGRSVDSADELPPGRFKIDGIVEDGDGKPLADIPVVLKQAMPEFGFLDGRNGDWLATSYARRDFGDVLRESTSGADGSFRFEGLPAGRFCVEARAPAPWTSGYATAGLGVVDRRVRLVLVRGHPLRIRVVDENGKGIAAHIHAWRIAEPNTHRWSVTDVDTDEDGRVTIHAPQTDVYFDVNVPGRCQRKRVIVAVPREDELVVELALSEGATLRGRVADTQGEPIPGALLRAVSRRDDEELSPLTQTDEEGRYEFRGLLPERLLRLQVYADGFLAIEDVTQGRDLEPDGELRLDVTMLRGATIRGVVRGPKGEPIGGAWVIAQADRARDGHYRTDRNVSDATGRFELREVPFGPGRLLVAALGYFQDEPEKGPSATAYEVEEERQAFERNVQLAACVPLRGRVVDPEGKPLSQVLVDLWGGHALWRPGSDVRKTKRITDEDGAFEYAVPPGPTPVWLRAKSRGARNEKTRVQVGAEGATVEIVLHPGGVVHGQVQMDAVARRGLRVRTKSPIRYTPVRSDGTYRLENLTPGRNEIFVVDHQNTAVSPTVSFDLTWGQVLEIPLRARKPWATVSGTLVDASGEPMSGVSVRLHIERPGRNSSKETRTDRRGRFFFESLQDTGYPYGISIGGKRIARMIEHGEKDVRIEYPDAAKRRFLGTVTLPNGTPAAAGRVQIAEIDGGQRSEFGTPIVDGKFEVVRHSLRPEATYELSIREVRDARRRPQNVQPVLESIDPDTPLHISLKAGLRISGVVRDPTGAPLALEKVWLVRQDKGSRRVPLRRQLLTRPDGTFDFASLRPGRYQVRVEAGSEWVPTPWIAVEAGLDDMAITLQRGSTVQGRVVGSSGAPLPNVHVHFSWQAVVGVHRHGSSTARTDAAGAFTLTRVAPRAVGTLRVEGHYTPETTWNAASLKDIAAGSKGHVLTLKPGVFVSGEVVGPDGEDVQAWLVHCVNLKTKAETRGAFGADRRKFRVGPLEPGQYTLGFLVSGKHVAPEPTTVTAPASGLRIVAPRGVMLEGRITNGKPDVHLQGVIFGPTSTKPLFSVNVTGTGHFGLAVRSDAPHTLYFFGPAGSSRFALLENVLPSKGPYEIALRQGGVIRGRFEEVSSDPEQAPYVYVMSPIGFHVTGVVAKEGTFAIRGVPPGTYELIGFPDRHSRQTIEGVQVGDTGLVVRRPK